MTEDAERPPDRQRPLPTSVKLLGGVSFFTDVSSEMLYPVVPLFLTGVLGAPMAAVGLIEGLAEGTASLLKLPAGRIADRVPRRKPLVVAGYTTSALARPLLALAGSWPAVLGVRLLDRAGKGLRGPARDALIADSTHPGQRGRAFGLHRAMDTAGAVVGPLLGLVAMGALALDYRTIFWLAALPAAVSVGLLLLLREPPRSLPPPARGLTGALPGPELRRLLLIAGLFSLGNSSNAFLLLRARDLGWSDSGVIGLYALFNAVYALTATPLGALSDRLGRRTLVGAGFLAAGLVYAAFALNRSPTVAALLLASYGLYVAATSGAMKAWVTELCPGDEVATAMGWYQMVTGLGLLGASLLAGWLWTAFGAPAAFALGALLSFTCCVLLVWWPPQGARSASAPRR